jgi:hypothetical protein
MGSGDGQPRLGRMDTGVAIFPTHDAISPAVLARLAEERGHESLSCGSGSRP